MLLCPLPTVDNQMTYSHWTFEISHFTFVMIQVDVVLFSTSYLFLDD